MIPDTRPEQRTNGRGGQGPSSIRLIALVVLLIVAPIVLLFLPLALALAERAIFGTDQVEDFFRAIGLHKALEAIYDPLLDVLKSIFGWP